jgi:hypothetical protein
MKYNRKLSGGVGYSFTITMQISIDTNNKIQHTMIIDQYFARRQAKIVHSNTEKCDYDILIAS